MQVGVEGPLLLHGRALTLVLQLQTSSYAGIMLEDIKSVTVTR